MHFKLTVNNVMKAKHKSARKGRRTSDPFSPKSDM